eukprot:1154528-Pelagomonas_calceolata.AAC.2
MVLSCTQASLLKAVPTNKTLPWKTDAFLKGAEYLEFAGSRDLLLILGSVGRTAILLHLAIRELGHNLILNWVLDQRLTKVACEIPKARHKKTSCAVQPWDVTSLQGDAVGMTQYYFQHRLAHPSYWTPLPACFPRATSKTLCCSST